MHLCPATMLQTCREGAAAQRQHQAGASSSQGAARSTPAAHAARRPGGQQQSPTPRENPPGSCTGRVQLPRPPVWALCPDVAFVASLSSERGDAELLANGKEVHLQTMAGGTTPSPRCRSGRQLLRTCGPCSQERNPPGSEESLFPKQFLPWAWDLLGMPHLHAPEALTRRTHGETEV